MSEYNARKMFCDMKDRELIALMHADRERQAAFASGHLGHFGSHSVLDLECECENPKRGWYTARDGLLHCDQCDGRKPKAAS